MSRAWEDYSGPLCDCPGETYGRDEPAADRYDGYDPGDAEAELPDDEGDTDLDEAWDELTAAERRVATMGALR